MVVETNLDDLSSELLGTDFQDGLLQQGAIDFHFTAIQMKKGRPGIKLSVLVPKAELEQVNGYILEHTSSIGLRFYPIERTILERQHLTVQTPYGPIQVKQVTTPSGEKRQKIEYESLRSIKESHNISILKLQEELYPLVLKTLGHEKK